MLQILAATSNKHKVEEFKAAFAPLLSKMTILTADEIHGYPDIEENGTSFEENADIKAREASAYADMPAFADDSGLEVAVLNGAPGIFSARYAGDHASDAERIRKLLEEMKGKTNRRAREKSSSSPAAARTITRTSRATATRTFSSTRRPWGCSPTTVARHWRSTSSTICAA